MCCWLWSAPPPAILLGVPNYGPGPVPASAWFYTEATLKPFAESMASSRHSDTMEHLRRQLFSSQSFKRLLSGSLEKKPASPGVHLLQDRIHTTRSPCHPRCLCVQGPEICVPFLPHISGRWVGCWVTKSCLTLCDPMYLAHQVPLSMGFSRQETWSGLPFPTPEKLPHPGIEPESPALQADSLKNT